MLNLLGLAILGSYNYVSGQSALKSSTTCDLANLAQNSFNQIPGLSNGLNNCFFENLVVTQNVDEAEISSLGTNILMPEFSSSLMNPTSSTVFNNYTYTEYVRSSSSTELIQSVSTTHADAFNHVDLPLEAFSQSDENPGEFDEDLIDDEQDPHTKVNLKDNTEPEGILTFEEFLNKGHKKKENPCTFTAFVAPQHGFLEVNCPSTKDDYELNFVSGFYPSGNQAQIIASYVFGSFVGIDRFKHIGKILSDSAYANDCKYGELTCAKADFAISREQADQVQFFISETSNACKENDVSKCTYSLLGGSSGSNCVDFVEKTAKVAGIKESIFERLKIFKNRNSKPIKQGFFSLADKAWKYIRAKTWGKVNLRAD